VSDARLNEIEGHLSRGRETPEMVEELIAYARLKDARIAEIEWFQYMSAKRLRNDTIFWIVVCGLSWGLGVTYGWLFL